ncbi:TPA: 30S ribosomal protein S17 [Patescibacteria group bacterium]|jgi:small subunit ribosomal protein S17|nr:30S ribosomal protein S17 [Patescibacteria group bacterium]|tara:strand:- start:9576 stop:9827 length:252 start_codon:yes stop_codon:yes gene_type:complete
MENKKEVKRRKLEGVVVSDKMEKTATVEVERFKKHSRYLKYFKTSKKYKAHDEKNEYKTGDKVVIESSRPLSKDKRWVIVSKI